MKSVHFFISNRNHHWEMIKPVIPLLQQRGIQVTLVSLCEFRRMDTPRGELEAMNVPYHILGGLKTRVTSTSTGKKYIGSNTSWSRNVIRWILWILRLRPSLSAVIKQRPSLVIVPNDIAFPFNRICKWLTARDISFLLFQEGIRFPLPNEVVQKEYGSNGAVEILAWGKASADYFRALRFNKTLVREMGNPRFDQVLGASYAEAIRDLHVRFGEDKNAILYVSNPVDDQGFCSYQAKLDLFDSFLRHAEPLITNHHTRILVRLHPREDVKDFMVIVQRYPFADRVSFVQEPPLFAILQIVSGTVVLASTVGLESMLFNTPVAVVSLPEHGFVHDYVSSGCAIGIDVNSSELASTLRQTFWTERSYWKQKCESYITLQLSNLGSSAVKTADHIINVINR